MKSEELKEWYINNKKIFFSSIELTQNCNFNCRHCYCADNKSKNLTLEDYINLIDKLHSTGCLFINFTGGEIFTNGDFVEIYTYAKNKGFIIDLLTNASLINDQLVELFKMFPPNNIAVTIYGTNENDYLKFTGNKDNFNKTIAALNLLKKNNIHFVLRTVATKTLKDSLMRGEFEKLAEKYETSFKYDPIVFPKTTGDITPLIECMEISQIIELERNTSLRKRGWENTIKLDDKKTFNWSCQAGVSSLAIDFQGNAFVCGLYRKNPISLIKNEINIVLEHLRDIHKEHLMIVQTNECSQCEKRSICKWCPAYSLIYNNNDSDKISFFCELAKARLNAFGHIG